MAGRVAVGLLAVAVVVVVAGGLLLGRDAFERPARPAPPSVRAPQEVSRIPTAPATPAEPNRSGTLGAQLVRRVWLRERPSGRVVRTLGRRTGFGSPAVLAVVAQRPGWLGVLSQHMPNSRTGWIPADGAQLRSEPYTVHVDLSARRLLVRYEGRVVRRVRVAVGRPGTTTPTGRFAVTDSLRVAGDGGGPYGCCAIALTGRQPNVPQGWSGGDRIAIHGTSNESSLGSAASSGCVRAGERDMRWLMPRLPAGTLVRIRA